MPHQQPPLPVSGDETQQGDARDDPKPAKPQGGAVIWRCADFAIWRFQILGRGGCLLPFYSPHRQVANSQHTCAHVLILERAAALALAAEASAACDSDAR